jgi:3-phosphoshikimate 1-carboxyvinyltransferase
MIQKFDHIEKVKGELKLPGDKSISHRAVMFSSMAKGTSIIRNCSNSDDVHSTINCFSELGIRIEKKPELIKIYGNGFKGFIKPGQELFAGNSGTTSRLLSGILAAQNFESVITGDESLSNRPMLRVVEPLQFIGADISASELGTLPLVIKPSGNLHTVEYKMKVASAQVKSALILAALHLDDQTIIHETTQTRDHTERMLGLDTESSDSEIKIIASKKNYPQPFEMTIPSDISTASFFIVLTLLLKNSELLIKNVSLNPTRTGIIKILIEMGGLISIEKEFTENGEIRGDLLVKSSELKSIKIPDEIIPSIIDEIPILSVAGLFAEGNFKIGNAKELRIKESDRIKSLCDNYQLLGLDVIESADGFEIGGTVTNYEDILFESFGDHRIAMAFSILAMILRNGGSVNQFESVAVSNPDFIEQIKNLI